MALRSLLDNVPFPLPGLPMMSARTGETLHVSGLALLAMVDVRKDLFEI